MAMKSKSHAQPDQKLTVSEIAELAGVSPSTVSKVINGREGISAQTRLAVERVLEESGYSKPLVTTKLSPTIELVVEYLEHNGTLELIKHASYWAQQDGLAITITQVNHGQAGEQIFRGIIDRNPQGVILQQMSALTSHEKNLLQSRDIPVVIIDPVDRIDNDVMSVSIDNWSAGFQAGKHLLSLGHKRIAVIHGALRMQTALARFNGFMSALQQEGIQIPEEYVRAGDYFPAHTSYQSACELMELPEPPTAIFCCNDLSAIKAYRAAREHHIALPSELSIMGFDDIFPAADGMPSLSTIHQPFNQIAQRAVQMIIDTRNHKPTDRHIIYPTHVVARESTVPPIESATAADTAN